jgi:hypothetical protein
VFAHGGATQHTDLEPCFAVAGVASCLGARSEELADVYLAIFHVGMRSYAASWSSSTSVRMSTTMSMSVSLFTQRP